MAKIHRNSAEALAERALEPEVPGGSGTETAAHKRTIDESEQPRRMIYGGTMPAPAQTEASADRSSSPRNCKITRRKVSPFNIIVLLIGLAAAIVLYVGNIIAVNQLVNDIHRNEVRLQVILNEQEVLRARINQMSSLERIRKRAEDELGLRNPSAAPGWLRVDPDKVREIEEASTKQ